MKDYRFACCLSTYKRFDNMQLQIYQMLHQNYDNFHVFVACKGISEYNFEKFIKPQFKKYIEEGKLTLRHFSNKNQFSNFFDTIRGININEYDYFLKIDDDDLYRPNYIKTYNKHANERPETNFFFRKGNLRLIRLNYKGYTSLENTGTDVFMGPTLCMTKSHIKDLIEAEKSVANLEKFIIERNLPKDLLKCGFTEDRLFCMSMKPQFNIANSSEELSCINFSNASTSRGGFILGGFHQKNSTFNKNPDYYEHILSLRRPKFGLKDIRIFNKKAHFLYSKTLGDVKEFADERLVIEWPSRIVEKFTKVEDKSWVLS